MRRREFVILGGAAIGWPLAAQGQQKARRIGILMGYAEGDAEAKDLLLEFTQALSEWRLRASSRDGGDRVNPPASTLTMLLSRHTRRREFIFFGAAGVAWPLAAHGQRAGV